MTAAMLLHEYGDADQLVAGEREVGEPGTGEVLIRHTGIGVNYIDTYFRRGIYPIKLPAVIGDQAAGVVEALGAGVERFSVGDRVGYCSSSGAYIERRVIAADDLVRLPDGISDDLAAATLTRGMTAEYLLCRLYPLKAGETCVVHAATGGTGLIVTQWAHHLGARVIATVGSDAKLDAARAAGADLAVRHNDGDFAAAVRDFTDGRGVDVVYDSIGRDTFAQSIACLRPRGMMVAYGNASGKPDPFDVLELARNGSLFLTRPRLNEYVATVAELEGSAARYFEVVMNGAVTPHPVKHFPLSEAPAAHRHLEDRATADIPVLVP